jgi:hypothetical protein
LLEESARSPKYATCRGTDAPERLRFAIKQNRFNNEGPFPQGAKF